MFRSLPILLVFIPFNLLVVLILTSTCTESDWGPECL